MPAQRAHLSAHAPFVSGAREHSIAQTSAPTVMAPILPRPTRRCGVRGRAGPHETLNSDWFAGSLQTVVMHTPETDQSSEREPQQALLVTLVHGTFGRKARWVRPESAMWRCLTATGGTCCTFLWSGRNSHRARFRAAEGLAEHLDRQRREHPGSRQVVVGHSHGGNIATHAVWRLGKDAEQSISVVTLATPFLFARLKERPSVVLRIREALRPIVFMLGIAWVMPAIATGQWLSASWFGWLLRATSILTLLQDVGIWRWTRIHGNAWAGDASAGSVRAQFVEQVQTPPCGSPNLLVIRAAADEASSTLALVQLSGWIDSFLSQRIYKAAFALIIGVGILVGPAISTVSGGTEAPLSEAVVGWSSAALVALAFGIYISFLVRFFVGFIHGSDGMAPILFATISAEATPPGTCIVKQRKISQETSRLSHSNLCEDPEVVAWVVSHAIRPVRG